MSLYGALYSGVSGLSAQSSAMGAISDNISNVNTVGYKGTTVNFQTLVTSQVATTNYSPGGVQSKPRAGVDVQGLLQATNSSTDIALNGQGFFVVSSTATPGTEGGEYAYTRAGSFTPDSNGYLQNSAGFYLQGWPLVPTDGTPAAVPSQETINGNTYMKAYKMADGDYHYVNQNVISPSELQPLNVNTIGGAADPTSQISLSANLPSGDPIYDSSNPTAGGIHTTNVLLYDSLGNSTNATFTWTKTAQDAWQLSATPPSGAATMVLYNSQVINGQTVNSPYSAQGQVEFNSVPPAQSYFTINSTIPGNTSSSYVQIQFYNSSLTGQQSVDPTADGPGLGSSSNPYVLGVDLSGITSTAQVATAVQTAISDAANNPAAKNTFDIAQVLQGGMADGASRFNANSNGTGILGFVQEPGAAAVSFNCISNTTTGLGSAIIESGADIGSGSNLANPITTGQFTVPAVTNPSTAITPSSSPWITTNATQQTNSFTVNSINAGSYTGSNSFTLNNVPTTGSLYVAGIKVADWNQIVAGAAVVGPPAIAAPPGAPLPNVPATTTAQVAANAVAAITAALAAAPSPVAGVTVTNPSGSTVTITTSNAAAGDSAITQITPDAPDSNGKMDAADITWASGAAGTQTQLAPSSPDVMQVGNLEIPWAEIVAGQVTDYYDNSTGQYMTLTTPVTLPHGTSGTDVTAIASNANLAANIATLFNPGNGSLFTTAAGATETATPSGSATAVNVVNPGITSVAQNTTNNAEVDISMDATNPTGSPNTLLVNNSTVTWANGSLGNAAQIVMGQVGTYATTGASVVFNGNGTPSKIWPNAIQLTWADGAQNQDSVNGSSSTDSSQISLNLGSPNESNGLTQLGGDYQLLNMTQNGAKFGNFSGVSISTNGVVTALFDNGVRTPVFQIPIATFNNPDGMSAVTGNVWTATSTSGNYVLHAPQEAGSGSVEQSSLEASTVDLGTEFTQMITVQNAYSAAAKVITTTDSMLNSLIQIQTQ